MKPQNAETAWAPKPMLCEVEGQLVQLLPRTFTSGSRGWHGQMKVTCQGERCQLSVICTIIGSKPTVPEANGTVQKATRPGGSKKGRKNHADDEVASDPSFPLSERS